MLTIKGNLLDSIKGMVLRLTAKFIGIELRVIFGLG